MRTSDFVVNRFIFRTGQNFVEVKFLGLGRSGAFREELDAGRVGSCAMRPRGGGLCRSNAKRRVSRILILDGERNAPNGHNDLVLLTAIQVVQDRFFKVCADVAVPGFEVGIVQ